MKPFDTPRRLISSLIDIIAHQPGHLEAVLVAAAREADDHDVIVAAFGGDARRLDQCFSPEFMAKLARPLLVIEDSDHQRDTVLAVLNFVAVGKGTSNVTVVDPMLKNSKQESLKVAAGQLPVTVK